MPGIQTEAALRFVSFYCLNVAGRNNKKRQLGLKLQKLLAFASDFDFKVDLVNMY